jgi:CRP-like cAMP-binding protein
MRSGSHPLQRPAALHLSLSDLTYGSGRKGKRMRFAKGREIITAGNRHEKIYANHDGWLFRYKLLHSGRRQILDFILPGEVFGFQAFLFSGALYSVATATDAVLTAFPAGTVEQMFDRSSDLSKALFWSAMREAAILGERLTNAGRRSAYERVSHMMLELFVRLSSAGLVQDKSFPMPLTQEQIGDALGLTTIHVNRTLRALRADGLIRIDGRYVTIGDYDALAALSDFEHSYLDGREHCHPRDAVHPGKNQSWPIIRSTAGRGKVGGRRGPGPVELQFASVEPHPRRNTFRSTTAAET